MFSRLFFNYFLLSLIVNDLQMHFSPFFWLDPKELKTSLTIYFTPSPLGQSFLTFISYPSFFISPSLILNYQFSILNSQKAYLLETTKRESISILTGSVFDSRLVWNR